MTNVLNRIHIGDALTILKTWPDEFVDCVCTSPPYWSLRDYGIEGQLGLEKTPEEYVENMVEVFREVKRVMKKEGTLWLNLGDSYAGSGKGLYGDGKSHGTEGKKQSTNVGSIGLPVWKGSADNGSNIYGGAIHNNFSGLGTCKPKDLIGIPWRVAFALQADGWYLRSDIIWAKLNPMPESVRDRPTKAHEYIFLLSKSPHYYFDQDAVREPHDENLVGVKEQVIALAKTTFQVKPQYNEFRAWYEKQVSNNSKYSENRKRSGKGEGNSLAIYYKIFGYDHGRNIRTVWNVATQPYSEAHFATFPEEIPERCIKAGTSEKGCCPKCGKAWVRVVEKKYYGGWNHNRTEDQDPLVHNKGHKTDKEYQAPQTLGWKPSCSCGQEPVPCVVLDPFIGSGTVAKVAIRLRRQWVGIDINPAYGELAEKRKAWTQVEMIDA
jgi:DNA modification methylase